MLLSKKTVRKQWENELYIKSITYPFYIKNNYRIIKLVSFIY